MTISNSTRTAGPFIGNNAAVNFPFTFKVFSTSDVVVSRADGATERPLILNSEYSVTLNNNQDANPGGVVKLNAVLSAGHTLTLTSSVDDLQGLSLSNQGGFYPKVIEAAFDRLTILVQQLKVLCNRSLRLPLEDTGVNAELPNAATRAGKLLSFDQAGKPVAVLPYKSESSYIGWIQNAIGAIKRTVQEKLGESVSVADFGAVCDGVSDDTAAVQAAINYCLSFPLAKSLRITGRCLLTAPLIVDRLVNSAKSEFRIIGEGSSAGFYTKTGVNMFDSTLPMTTAPQSEWVTFENIQFETSSIFNASYVLSKKFLRIKFINCMFRLIRCIWSDTYVQTMYFSNCNIRNNPASFIHCAGLYDVTFNHCIHENGNTLVRSIDAARGANGLRVIDNVIEAIQSSVLILAGAKALDIIGNHFEANFSPEFNLFGGLANKTVNVIGNYIFNPNGPSFYYGPTDAVFSAGNRVQPSLLHSNAEFVTDLISMAEACDGGVSDAVVHSTVNGVYRAGNANKAWTHSDNHIVKSASGMWGFGGVSVPTTRAAFWGKNTLSGDFAGKFYDSLGNPIAGFENDRQVHMPALSTGTGTSLVVDATGYLRKASSSRRYKEDIQPFTGGLDWVMACAPVVYTLKACGSPQIGFIAEDFHDPRFVTYRREDVDDPESELIPEGVNYGQMGAPVIGAIQELQKKIADLEAKVAALGVQP